MIKLVNRSGEDLNCFVEKYVKKEVSAKHYIWGCNVIAKEIMAYLKKSNIDIECFIESDICKTGGLFCGRQIKTIGEIEFSKESAIWIAHNYYMESLELLYDKKHGSSIVVYNSRCNALNYYEEKEGQKNLDLLSREFDKIFLYPAFSIGDAYIISCFFNDYLQVNKIQKYIILTKSSKIVYVFEMFGLLVKNIRENEFEYLSKTKSEKNIINLCPPVVEKINIIEFYLKHLFKNQFLKCQSPQVDLNSEFEDFKKNKTIVLSPYSNSIKDELSEYFWIDLAERMKDLGFEVVTNCSTSEEAIYGTKKVMIDLNKFLSFVSYCGFFVGYRSGLCDLVCQMNIKSVIIYPDKKRKEIDELERIKSCTCKEMIKKTEEELLKEILEYISHEV